MENMKVVIIWLDAFSNRYLSPRLSPFMWKLIQEAFSAELSPLFAYTGIGYCFRTGTSINTHKIWNDHILNTKKDYNKTHGMKILKWWLRVIDRVSFSDDVNKMLRYVAFKICGVKYGIPHLIPESLEDYFVVKEKYIPDDLYEILTEHNKKYIITEPKFNILETNALMKVPKLIEHCDLVILKLNSLDRLGHKYGPLSEQVRDRVSFLDKSIEKMYKLMDKKRTVLIVMSDHGMCPIKGTINIQDSLNKSPSKIIKDYFAYIGSTVLMFWFNNKKAREFITHILSNIDQGKILGENDMRDLGLDKIGIEYGELIFALKEGYIFFPDFYRRRRPPLGMHGYATTTYDHPILLIVPSRDSDIRFLDVDKARIIDLVPTILNIIGVYSPPHFEGRSLVAKNSY